MHRAILIACLPWLALLLTSVGGLWLTARLSRARLHLGRLWQAHRDESGSVQSLSFVLTLPIFVMFLLFIVQVSQIMIATMVVNYAAFAAARSAIVWIPADLGPDRERANCISTISPSPSHRAEGGRGEYYVVRAGGPKFQKIQQAAVLACTSICPSRPLASSQWPATATAVKSVYQAIAPRSGRNAAVPRRLENKLSYSAINTSIEVSFLHKSDEPPFGRTDPDGDDPTESYDNQIGWQDPITVAVTHNYALMPGPGRLLSKRGQGTYSATKEKLYVYPIRASATLTNEGERSLLPYEYHDF